MVHDEIVSKYWPFDEPVRPGEYRDTRLLDSAVNRPFQSAFGKSIHRTILDKVLTDLPGNVALLARPTHIEQSHLITPEVILCALELLSATHENVVIDLPRQIDQCGLAALTRADIVLITCQLFVPSIRNTKRYLDALTQAGIAEERIEVVVNRSDSSGGRITTKDLEQLIGKPAYAIVPNDYHYVARSLDFGQPIASGHGNNPVRHAMRRMALKILGASDTKDDKRGFLKRLLSKQARPTLTQSGKTERRP